MAQERESGGDLILADMGEGLGFRPGSFDGALRYIYNYVYANNSVVFNYCGIL